MPTALSNTFPRGRRLPGFRIQISSLLALPLLWVAPAAHSQLDLREIDRQNQVFERQQRELLRQQLGSRDSTGLQTSTGRAAR